MVLRHRPAARINTAIRNVTINTKALHPAAVIVVKTGNAVVATRKEIVVTEINIGHPLQVTRVLLRTKKDAIKIVKKAQAAPVQAKIEIAVIVTRIAIISHLLVLPVLATKIVIRIVIVHHPRQHLSINIPVLLQNHHRRIVMMANLLNQNLCHTPCITRMKMVSMVMYYLKT